MIQGFTTQNTTTPQQQRQNIVLSQITQLFQLVRTGDERQRDDSLKTIPELIQHASRILPGESFSIVAHAVGSELSQLAESGAAAAILNGQGGNHKDKMSCVRLIKSLATVEFFEETSNKISLFFWLLRSIVVQSPSDKGLLESAADALGVLAKCSWSQATDIITSDIRMALDWLRFPNSGRSLISGLESLLSPSWYCSLRDRPVYQEMRCRGKE